MKKIMALFAVLLFGLMAVSVAAMPVEIDWLKIDGDKVENGSLIDVDRNSGIDIKIQFVPGADVDNMYIEAFISGYEYGILRDQRITIQDVEAGKTYKEVMHIDLPQNMEKDEYSLRVLMHDRNGPMKEWIFDIDVGAPRHALLIRDVILEPENSVKTGRSLIANARVKNIGDKDEESIKITMSIPELGLSDSEFIDELESEDSITSESLHIRIPDCAEPGEYDLIVKAMFNEGSSDADEYKTKIVVTDGDVCEVGGRSVITIGPTSQEIARGTGASYPITIENAGSTTKQYTVSIEGTSDFAVAQVTPSAVVTVAPGKSETVYAYVAVDKDASEGEHAITISVKSDGETLQSVTVKANVVKGDSSGIVAALEYGLIILVVLLVILGLIVGFNKMRENNDEDSDEETGQTYY